MYATTGLPRARVPGFHGRSLVGMGEGCEAGIARVDVGKVALDELALAALGPAAEVAPHRVNGLPAVVLREGAARLRYSSA